MNVRNILNRQSIGTGMANGKHPDDEDLALFRDSIKGVTPLRHGRKPPQRARVRPVPRKTREDEAQVRRDMIALDFDGAEVETGDELLFARPGLQHGLMRKLRRGQYVTRAELDLHGMTAAEAQAALGGFLARCQARDLRCVRIVHGKGLSSPGRKPVLKSRVNAWLQRSDAVLAFCSARPQDGGTGAVYVLLKKQA
jgi:DNA-nicking Smr family endonuclease